MRARIDYYFSLISPFSFMGLARLREYATRTGSSINYLPLNLPDLFGRSGTLPLGQRPEARKAYRLEELERWRLLLSIDLNLNPKFFPADEAFAVRLVAATIAEGLDPGDLCQNLHELVWLRDQDISDRKVVAAALAACDYPDSLLAKADQDEIAAIVAKNTDQAVDAGVFGAPAYIIDGEIFWGQDRLDFVARKLGLRH